MRVKSLVFVMFLYGCVVLSAVQRPDSPAAEDSRNPEWFNRFIHNVREYKAKQKNKAGQKWFNRFIHNVRENKAGQNKDLILNRIRFLYQNFIGRTLNEDEKEYSVDEFVSQALIWASYKSFTDMVHELLQVPGIDVNMQNNNGDTALIVASNYGYVEVVRELLLVPTINVNLQGRFGWTALIAASRSGHVEIVRELLQVPNIDVNMQNSNDDTALISASKEGYVEIVKELLQVPTIDVNRQDYFGDTALIVVSKKGYAGVARELLLVPTINLSLINSIGDTALSYVMKNPSFNLIFFNLTFEPFIALKTPYIKDVTFLPKSLNQLPPKTTDQQKKFIDLYRQFLQGSRDPLYNWMFDVVDPVIAAFIELTERFDDRTVPPPTFMPAMWDAYMSRVVPVLQDTVKQDSIQPLLLFLARTESDLDIVKILLSKFNIKIDQAAFAQKQEEVKRKDIIQEQEDEQVSSDNNQFRVGRSTMEEVD